MSLRVHGRPLRALAELSGFVGAEITGAMGFAIAAGLIATNWVPTTLAGVILLPVLMAGAGPVGYDMAQSWVPEDEKAPAFRPSAHAAGVAAALLLMLAYLGVAVAMPGERAAVLFMVTLFGLPYLAVMGRRLADRTLSDSPTLLPVSLVIVVGAAPAIVFVYLMFIGRLIGDD